MSPAITGYAQSADDLFVGICGQTIEMDVLANDIGYTSITGFMPLTPFQDAGSLEISANLLRFTPHTDFSGTIAFDYTPTDGAIEDQGSASVTVTCPSPVDVTIARTDYAALCGPDIFVDLLRNDTYVDVSTFQLSANNPNLPPANLTVNNSGGFAGSIIFNSFTGDPETQYEVNYLIDGQQETLILNGDLFGCTNGLNNASVDDAYEVDQGTSTQLNFMDNDMGGTITTGLFNRFVSIPTEGALIIDSAKDRYITYVAPSDFIGITSFNHIIDDFNEIFIQQTIALTVAVAPTPPNPATDDNDDQLLPGNGDQAGDSNSPGAGGDSALVLIRTGGIF